MNDLGLSSLISDGMIIQRDCEYPIWSDKKISVSFLGKNYESQKKSGRYYLALEPVKAGGPFTMEISCDDDPIKLTIKDIYSGDVWLCAGQSNMEMMMDRLYDDFTEEWEIAENREQGVEPSVRVNIELPIIRHFRVPQEWDFASPHNEIKSGNWVQASKETLDEFTATGWFFAKNLYAKYKTDEGQIVPIGLVNTAWGGTPVEAWMSEDALSPYPAILASGKQYVNSALRDELVQRSNYAILEWNTNLNNEDVGFALGWINPDTDISSWDDISLPGDFAIQKENLKDFCGAIWLAKDFEVTADFAKSDAKIWLGTIIDADTVYINGTEVGNTGYRYPPRKYVPKNLLKEGKNRIVIRVTCNNGQGGVTTDKPFKIFTDNDSVEFSGKWKYNIGATAPVRPDEVFFQWQPLGNYNAMIAPVIKYPLKGVIWYQCESNESRPHQYAALFKDMIQDWRAKNGNKNLPFFFVQLPIFLEETDNCETHNWALIREAQAAALSLPATGMAAAWEFGEWNDIHPINKKDVGYRLFLAAEKYLFGAENTSPGAMVKRWDLQDGKLFVYFNNVGSGIKTKEILTQSIAEEKEIKLNSALSASSALNKTTYVTIISEEGQTNLPVKIEGADCISVDLSGVNNPKKVLYAWANNPRYRNLFNSEGLPVLGFRITL